MKTLLSLFLLLALGASAATGIKISEYPNTAVLTNSELFIVAVTNVTPATNRNITYGQLRSLLSSNNFVGSFTGDGRNASNVVARFFSSSNAISGSGMGILYVPDSNTFTNSLILGNGGSMLNTSGLPAIDPVSSNVLVSTFNTFFGINSGVSNTTGSLNLFAGNSAGMNNVNGCQNTFLGSFAGEENTSGYHNTLVGCGSGQVTTTGFYDSFFGTDSGLQNITGSADVYFGTSAGTYGTNSSFNTLVGVSSGAYNQADHNVGIGYASIYRNQIGSNLVAVGDSALGNNIDGNFITAIGSFAANKHLTGSTLTAVGYYALSSSTNSVGNTAGGYESMMNCTSGQYSTAWGHSSLFSLTSGDKDCGFGVNTLYDVTSGGENTAVGYNAGYNSGVPLPTISGNTFIGSRANASLDGIANSTAIGYNSQVTKANQVVIGNSSVTETILRGNVGVGVLTPIVAIDAIGKISVSDSAIPTTFAGANQLSACVSSNKAYALNLGFGLMGSAFWAGVVEPTDNGSETDLLLLPNAIGNVGIGTGLSARPERLTVNGSISASGSVISTNAFVMGPVSAGPVWCTNGLAAMWNSNNNGQATIYLRTSAAGATTYADKLVAP